MVAHALALELGMTVAELGERMTWREFADWPRFFEQRENERNNAKQEKLADMPPDSLIRAFGAQRG